MSLELQNFEQMVRQQIDIVIWSCQYYAMSYSISLSSSVSGVFLSISGRVFTLTDRYGCKIQTNDIVTTIVIEHILM